MSKMLIDKIYLLFYIIGTIGIIVFGFGFLFNWNFVVSVIPSWFPPVCTIMLGLWFLTQLLYPFTNK